MNEIDRIVAGALSACEVALVDCFLSARVRKFPKDWSGAPARHKAKGVRGRKRALYASLTGFKRLRIRVPNQYTRLAE